MVDVLLTHSYHLYYDRKQVPKMQPYPPLGTLYAAALLRQQGFSVALFDAILEDPEAGFPVASGLRRSASGSHGREGHRLPRLGRCSSPDGAPTSHA